MRKTFSLKLSVFTLVVILMFSNINVMAQVTDNRIYFDQGDGTQDYVVSHEIPKDFDPLTASDDQINYYGLSKRPSDINQLNDWKTNIDTFKKCKYVKPSFEKVGNKKKSTPIYNATSISWSGVVKQWIQGESAYDKVNGRWTVPEVPTNVFPAYSSEWVGLGGYGVTTSLAQIGTTASVPSSGTSSYYPWWEVLGPINNLAEQKITAFTCTANQTMLGAVRVYYSSGYTYVSFYLCNVTTNIGTSFIYMIPTSGDYCNNFNKSAEWIVERPQVPGGGTYYFPKVGNGNNVHFWDCWYHPLAGANYSITNSTATYVSLIRSGVTLAAPQTISTPGSFIDVWYHN